jgi:hypothetical protein
MEGLPEGIDCTVHEWALILWGEREKLIHSLNKICLITFYAHRQENKSNITHIHIHERPDFYILYLYNVISMRNVIST